MLPFPAGPSQIAVVLSSLKRQEQEPFWNVHSIKSDSLVQNMFLCYRAKEDHPPSWENLLLIFFLHVLNKLSLAFKIPLFTIIEQSKAQCFPVTFPPPLFESAVKMPICSLLQERYRTSPASCRPAIGCSQKQLCGWLVSSLSKVDGLLSGK